MHSLLIIIWTYPSSPFHRLKYHNWKFPLTKPKVRFNFQSNSSIDQHTTEKNWVSLTLRLTRFMLVLAIFGHSFFVCPVCLFLFFQRDRMTHRDDRTRKRAPPLPGDRMVFIFKIPTKIQNWKGPYFFFDTKWNTNAE